MATGKFLTNSLPSSAPLCSVGRESQNASRAHAGRRGTARPALFHQVHHRSITLCVRVCACVRVCVRACVRQSAHGYILLNKLLPICALLPQALTESIPFRPFRRLQKAKSPSGESPLKEAVAIQRPLQERLACARNADMHHSAQACRGRVGFDNGAYGASVVGRCVLPKEIVKGQAC